ncbi:hypothetical protein DPX16_11034 [Anabarilius grahami]|uniref:Uncharacterized protein n=1 Tax=Anabarilius grahami TaxID=495550 RepID=A0A3N0Y210_ANAGA|nr:hypothetical protein DPX16_11034 [Anabarilius grahami]
MLLRNCSMLYRYWFPTVIKHPPNTKQLEWHSTKHRDSDLAKVDSNPTLISCLYGLSESATASEIDTASETNIASQTASETPSETATDSETNFAPEIDRASQTATASEIDTASEDLNPFLHLCNTFRRSGKKEMETGERSTIL